MFERLVAGVLVIGGLLWIASTLAIPDSPPLEADGSPSGRQADMGDPAAELPDLQPTTTSRDGGTSSGGSGDEDDDGDDAGQGDEPAPADGGERKGKGRKGGDG